MAKTKGRTAAATRELILLAAQDVVLTDGVAHLTLEKAAERAGLSKGGVLYHYKSRNDLVAAMVQRLAEQFEAGVSAAHRARPGMSFVQAYIEECLAVAQGDDEVREERVGAALIAAIAAEPALLAPLCQSFAGWQQQIERDAADPIEATVARLAADGLWLCELFGIDALSPQLREQVTERLRGMVS